MTAGPARRIGFSPMKTLSFALLSLGLIAASAQAEPRPNIIVILADDMGFSDIGCYGGEIPTPNLDRLAARGLRFTQFYNGARCCPSRAALLTGLYPHQAGVGGMTRPRPGPDGQPLPGYAGHLNDRCVTIAEVLRDAGYFTAMTGKWHLGQEHGVVPWKRGFERSLTLTGGGYFARSKGMKLFLNGEPADPLSGQFPADWYSTDLWTDYGLRFIDEARAAHKPFFLYLAHNAPHFPLQAPAEAIAKFRGKYLTGWDRLRADRYQRQRALGLIAPSAVLPPRPDSIKAWDSLGAAEKDRFDHIMAIYAACVYRMDESVGRLVEGLTQRGVLDDTLILFLSDNGGNLEKGPAGVLSGNPPGSADSTVHCGESWAMLQNTPFRRYKHFSHEGGIATPLIVHWPAGIAARGEFRRQPGHLIDLMATVVDVGAATYPEQFAGHPILPPEGRSLVPAFADRPLRRDALFWEHEGNAAVRVDDWKLVRYEWRGTWELYDLATDRTEQHDLAAARTALARDLARRWEAWAQRAQVLPVEERDMVKIFGTSRGSPD